MPVFKLENVQPEIDPSAFIAPNSTIIGKVKIGKNSSIWFNSVVRADIETITIGEETNVQDLTMCHADSGKPLVVGDRVTIGHNCVIHGCLIEDDCLVGMGVVIMNGAVIGRGSIIAAGSVILENTVIPEKSMVAGVPGKIKRELDDDMVTIISASAQVYKQRSEAYKDPDLFVQIDA